MLTASACGSERSSGLYLNPPLTTTAPTTVLYSSPSTPGFSVATTPVLPKVVYGKLNQTIVVNDFSIELSDLTSSSCSGAAPPGKGFVFVAAVVKTLAGNSAPDTGALGFNLTDNQGQTIPDDWMPAPCEPAGPPGGFILRFEVPGDGTGLVVWWNPGDTTGRKAAISLSQ